MTAARLPSATRGEAEGAAEVSRPADLESHLARVILLIVGLRYGFHFGATYGDVLAIATIPLWIGAFRRYSLGLVFAGLALTAAVAGLVLSEISKGDHYLNLANRRDVTMQLVGVVLALGVVLWARRLLRPGEIGLWFGLGMLADAVLSPGTWGTNPWKFAFCMPVAVIVLGAVALQRRLAVTLSAVAALALLSIALDSRAYSATLALVGVLVFWRWMRTARNGGGWLRNVALIAALAISVYYLATSLLVNGYLGRDAQVRSVEQIHSSGSLILGGRPELAATLALMRDRPEGYGVGVVPNPHDVLVAKSGLAGINYSPNNGYVDRYMFGGHIELHSVFGDMWANWGVIGLLLLALTAFLLVLTLADALSSGHGDVLVLYLCCWSLWNLAFSPFIVSVPVLVLAVGLSLRPRPASVSAGRIRGT